MICVFVPFFKILVFFLLGKDNTILVTPHLGMAKALGSIGKATKAIEIYQHVIALLESNRGAESKDLVVPLLSLGNLLLKEGRANDAESRFTRLNFLVLFPYSIFSALVVLLCSILTLYCFFCCC